MLDKFIKNAGERLKGKREKEDLSLEVSEVAEIAEKIFNRLDARMRELRELDERVAVRIETFEKLLARAENLKLPDDYGIDPKYREVQNLARKGLKVDEIAGILDMPRGEVDLILNIDK